MNGQTSSMICQRLDTYNGPYVLYPFFLSGNQLFELYHLYLDVHCIRYALHLSMTKALPLLQLIMTSTGWGSVITIFKVVGMTRTRTRDLPIQIRVYYYWAKSAGFHITNISIYILIKTVVAYILSTKKIFVMSAFN